MSLHGSPVLLALAVSSLLASRGAAVAGMRQLVCAALVATIPVRVATAQRAPSETHAQRCADIARVAAHGAVTPDEQMAWRTLASCPDDAARVMVAELRRLRNARSHGQLEHLEWVTTSVFDRRVADVMLEIARDRSAAPEARVHSVTMLIGQIAPPFSASPTSVPATYDPVRGCALNVVSDGLELAGWNLSVPRAAVRQQFARLLEDRTEPAVVRNAARCAGAALDASPTRSSPGSSSSEALSPRADAGPSSACSADSTTRRHLLNYWRVVAEEQDSTVVAMRRAFELSADVSAADVVLDDTPAVCEAAAAAYRREYPTAGGSGRMIVIRYGDRLLVTDPLVLRGEYTPTIFTSDFSRRVAIVAN